MFLTPAFPHEFKRTVLLDPGNHLSSFPLRGSHPLWRNVPDDFWFAGEDVTGPLHISPTFPWGIRFALCRFRSPLLAASRLISFPPGTRMFRFPGFPTPKGVDTEVSGSPIRQSVDQRPHVPPHRISQLGTTFIGARAKPFTNRRSSR